MGDLDEKTKIPFWWVAASIPFLIGAIAWMTSVDSKATEAREQLKGVQEVLMEVRDRMVRIEEHQRDLEGLLTHSQGGKK